MRALCKHPTRSGLLYAALYGTIFGSSDNGRSWAPIHADDSDGQAVSALLVIPEMPDRLYALTETGGVYAIPLEPK